MLHSTKISQAAVPNSKMPRNFRTTSIHGPGRGSQRTQPGNNAATQQGRAIPLPRHRKSAKISDSPRANAKPTAAPTSGEQQGVAGKAANMPPDEAASMRPQDRL